MFIMVEQVISYDEVVRRPRREVINQLLDYFAARHEQHEQMHLLEIAAISEGGDMAYKIRRRADDLDVEFWGA